MDYTATIQDPVVIEEYNPAWATMFDEAKQNLLSIIPHHLFDIHVRTSELSALSSAAACIQHMGSTSVPGLRAKAVIDIQLLVRSTENFQCGQPGCELLQQAGFEFRGESGIFDRLYFRFGHPVSHHLHVQRSDCRQTRRQLLLRGYFRHNPDAAEQYGTFKSLIAPIFRNNRVQYADCKNPFVDAMVARAEAWLQGINGVSSAHQFNLFSGQMQPLCELSIDIPHSGEHGNNSDAYNDAGKELANGAQVKENGAVLVGWAHSITSDILSHSAAVEPCITHMLRTALHMPTLDQWKFFKFEHRLKSFESIKRKVLECPERIVGYANAQKCTNHMVVSGHLNGCPLLCELRPQLHDALRYTLECNDDDKYTALVEATLIHLTNHCGMQVRKIFNFWPVADFQRAHRIAHVGIHVYLSHPRDKVTFELQFHTATATKVNAQLVRPVYLRYRVEADANRAEELRLQMCFFSESVPVPRGVERLGHLSDFPPTHDYLRHRPSEGYNALYEATVQTHCTFAVV